MRQPLVHTFGALLLLGCASRIPEPASPPPGFEHAYAAPDCAPWDGYAVSLVLRRTPLAPQDSTIEAGPTALLRLAVYPRDARGSGRSRLVPGTVRWPADPEVASGALCDNDRCEPIPRGSITIVDAMEDGRLRGTIDLTLAGGRSIRGSFDADWRPRLRLCG